MEIVIIKKGSGKNNSVMVFMENPVTMQEFIKKVKKRVID